MTQALTYAMMLAFFRNEMGFGGNNGLTDFKDLLGFDLQTDGMRVSLMVVTALLLALAYLCSHFIMKSRFGKVIVAIRDGEPRVQACSPGKCAVLACPPAMRNSTRASWIKPSACIARVACI